MHVDVREMTQKNEYSIGHWLVTSESFHPAWNQWIISCVTLRGEINGEESYRQTPDKTHEITALAVDPNYPLKFDSLGPIQYLHPPDQVIQISVKDDISARRTVEKLINRIADGSLSPDSNYRTAWEQLLNSSTFYAAINKGVEGRKDH